ncbi:MAG: hypothetical protein KF819_33980 [Labilithrix sp.]|nr:hypothetical protein [Labilithrix sp.]
MGTSRYTILICDEDRAHTDPLAFGLVELGHTVTVARTYVDAFAAACAHDYSVLVTAPFLRDRPALGLPDALGFRRPGLVLLMTRMCERLAAPVARSVGFERQLAKVVDPRALDRLVRATFAVPARGGPGGRPPRPREATPVNRAR